MRRGYSWWRAGPVRSGGPARTPVTNRPGAHRSAMRIAFPGCVLALLASLLPACSDDSCAHLVCSPQAAAVVSISASGGGPVPGAFVDVTMNAQSSRVGCMDEEAASVCVLGGGVGTLQLQIGAAGYLTLERQVAVQGRDAGCCGTEPITVSLDVVLERAP